MLPAGKVNDEPEPVGQYWAGTVPFGEKKIISRFAVAFGAAYAVRSPS